MLHIASTFHFAKKSTRAFEGDWCTEYIGIRVQEILGKSIRDHGVAVASSPSLWTPHDDYTHTLLCCILFGLNDFFFPGR